MRWLLRELDPKVLKAHADDGVCDVELFRVAITDHDSPHVGRRYLQHPDAEFARSCLKFLDDHRNESGAFRRDKQGLFDCDDRGSVLGDIRQNHPTSLADHVVRPFSVVEGVDAEAKKGRARDDHRSHVFRSRIDAEDFFFHC